MSLTLLFAGSSSSSSGGGSTPPTITSSASPSIAEGTTAVVTVTATGGETPYVFSISGGADAALFSIDSSTGDLTFDAAPDYTDPQDADTDNVYEVTVKVASAGGAFATQDISVTVTFSPIARPFDAFFDPNKQFYSDNGTTLAVAAATVQLGKNQMNAGASLNMSQSTSGNRMTYRVGANGKAWIEGTGSQYYDSLTIPCTAGLCTAHLLKFTDVGYHNVYDIVSPPPYSNMLWVNTSAKLALNADDTNAAGPYNDGTWRSVITYTSHFGQPAVSKLWIDGSLVSGIAATNVNANTVLALFNRATGTLPFKGGCGPFGFGSFDPTSYITDLATWMLAQVPT